jgi:tetratricopeptide (TPR) repeat protein
MKRGLTYARSKGQYDRAIADFNKAIEISPNEAMGFYSRGLAYSGKGQYDKAIADFNKAIEISPKQAMFYNDRGVAYYHKGHHDKAVADCTKALDIDPRYADAYNNRGTAFSSKGQYDRAITDYTKALDINPFYPDAYNNRGVAQYHKGDYDLAIADYTKAIDIKPKYADALFNRGVIWYQKGDYRQSIGDHTRVLEIAPDYADAYNQLAWILATCPFESYRNGTDAIELAHKAVELTPETDTLEPLADTLDTLAAAYAEAGEFVHAIRIQKRVVVLKTNEANEEESADYVKRLESYIAHKPWREEILLPADEHTTLSIPIERLGTIRVKIANVRSKATTESSILGKLKRGKKVTLIHQQDEWYAIKLPEGKLGWVHQSLFLESAENIIAVPKDTFRSKP